MLGPMGQHKFEALRKCHCSLDRRVCGGSQGKQALTDHGGHPGQHTDPYEARQPDAYGWTPRQLASQFGHNEALEFISTSLASKALRPAKWLLPEDSKHTTLQDGHRRVIHQDVFRFCISANQPVPALPIYYYEIELLDNETGESKGEI